MKRTLLALAVAVALAGCAATQSATAPAAPVPTYPVWLEMKPGYAEACAAAGKCIPMTEAELQEYAEEIIKRVLQHQQRSRI